MKYFLMETMNNFSDAPIMKDWFKQIDMRSITPERFGNIKDRTLVRVEPNPNLVYIDVISSPSFLVTKQVQKAIELYDPHIQHKQVILLDSESGLSEVYYLHAFKVLDCLSPESELSMDKSAIKKAVLRYDAVKDHGIFKIGGVRNNYIVARMDALESILRRNPRGIAIKELEIKDEGGK